MKASIKLNKSDRNSEGYAIIISIYQSQSKRFKKTIGRTDVEYWDDTQINLLPQHKDYNVLMPIILEYKSKVAKINLNNLSFNEAKNMFTAGNANSIKNKSIFDFIDTRISEKVVRGESVRSYNNMKLVLRNYSGGADIYLSSIDYEWINQFSVSKLADGCKQGGLMTYLSVLRAIFKEAQRRKSYNLTSSNPFIGVIKKAQKKDLPNFNDSDLKKLRSFEPHKFSGNIAGFKTMRKLAVWNFQYYIGGHDLVDVSQLKWSDIINSRVVFKRFKNKNKANGGELIDNLLCDEAYGIIIKYGAKNKVRIFDFIPDITLEEKRYLNYRNNYNRTLKKISTTVGLDYIIKSKTPRYFFRSVAGEKLIHDLIIYKIQGHKPTHVSFNYQSRLSYSVQDEGHLKVLGN